MWKKSEFSADIKLRTSVMNFWDKIANSEKFRAAMSKNAADH